MRTAGIIRTVDKMGRIVIPKEIRSQLNIQNETDSVEISVEGDTIIIRKHHPACLFCETLEDSIKYKGYNICGKCIQKLYEIKDEVN